MERFYSRERPGVHWWPRLELTDGTELYNLVSVGDDDVREWFMLDIPGEPVNSPRGQLTARPIAVRAEWFRNDFEKLATYVRWKALEWLNVGCETDREAQLRTELRRWRSGRGLSVRQCNSTGTPWRPAEEAQLLARHRRGASLQELARLHSRTVQAIRCRLSKLLAAHGEAA